jgi:hypothetical protein
MLPVVGATNNEVVGLIVFNIINRGVASFVNQTVAEDSLHPLKPRNLIVLEFLETVLSQPLKGHVPPPQN